MFAERSLLYCAKRIILSIMPVKQSILIYEVPDKPAVYGCLYEALPN